MPYKHIGRGMLILLCVTAAAGLISICFGEPAEKVSYIDAYQFVRSWNALAREKDSLTGGVKISSAIGRHTFRLGKNATLHYRVEKAGILRRKITFIQYANPCLSEFGAADVARLLSLLRNGAGDSEIYEKAVYITPFYTKSPFSKCK